MLLADEGFTGFHGSSLAFLALGIAAAAVWLAIFGWRWFATRPRMPDAGLETREVGPESPALVNLLVNRWCATRSAIQATLMDLASRKYLAIDMYGQDQFVVRIRPDQPHDTLTDYDRQLLDLVRQKATGGSVPAEALTLGEEGEADAWWKRFRKSVADDARDKRLARNRWAPEDWTILGAGLAVVFAFFAASFGLAHVGGRDSSGENTFDPEDWLLIGGVGWLGAMALLTRLRDLRDTAAGREACARWLGVRNYLHHINAFDDVPAAAVIIWERYLAYGVALGVAKEAAQELPMAPDDPETAWSRATGSWREIRVSYPEHFGFGGWPLGVFAGGVVRAVFFGVIAFGVIPLTASVSWDVLNDALSDRNKDSFLLAVGWFIVFGLMALYPFGNFLNGLIRMFHGLIDMVSKPLTVEGIVVKMHVGRVAVDDGHLEVARAWTPPAGSPGFSVGAHIRAIMSPTLAHVKSVEVLPRSDAPAGLATASAEIQA